jgi:hypothetical protein
MEYSAFPLSWPVGWARHASRIESRFGRYMSRPSVAKASELILRELQLMGVPDYQVVLSTNVQLRLDGRPYSNQKDPPDPGAAVYWRDKKDRRLVIACDKFRSVGENLHAIGLTIQATRAIQRWGAVTTEQAFAGYMALEEKTGPSCFEILGVSAQATRDEIIAGWRRKARETHPDNGGSTEAFDEISRAKDLALAHL